MENTTHRVSNGGGNVPSNYQVIFISSNTRLWYGGVRHRVVGVDTNASKEPPACIFRIEFYLSVK
jgi:hypothetical protein